MFTCALSHSVLYNGEIQRLCNEFSGKKVIKVYKVEYATVLCKSNANEIRRIIVFVLAKCRANFRAIFPAMLSEITGKGSSLKRNFVEISCDISKGQTKNRSCENSRQ